MKWNIFFILIISVFMSMGACSNREKKNGNNSADSLLTKTISFPKTLLQLDENKIKKIDSFNAATKGKRKIISIIDGNCSKCIINQLNNIDSIFNKLIINKNSSELIFILNVQSKDSAYFMQNLRPLIDARGIILWDNNYNFERKNKLFTKNYNLRTFMTNPKNRIIQYGNPLMNPELIYEYKEKLNPVN